MAYTFARVGAATAMRVEDYFVAPKLITIVNEWSGQAMSGSEI